MLKYQNVDACKKLDSGGTFQTPFTNDDPDDNSSVDLVIGITSQNDFVQINNIGHDDDTTRAHTPGSIYTSYFNDNPGQPV